MPLLVGCGSSFELRRIAPAQTVRGSVAKLDAARLERSEGVAIDFLTPARGFMATRAGELRRTDDGGRTWRTVSGGRRFVSLSFISAATGFGLTSKGQALATSDGGLSWRLLQTFRVGLLGGTIEFTDVAHGWVSSTGEGVFGTTDGGASWAALSLPCRHSAVAASFVDAAKGFLICGGGAGAGNQAKDFYATTDDGRTWTHRACTSGYRPACTSDLPGSGYVGKLDFRGAKTGLLAADRGGIWRTHDGGLHWAQTLLTDDAWFVVSMSWASSRTVFALTMSDGSLIRSDDAGAHWRRVSPVGAGLPTVAISFSSPTRGIGIGSERILVAGISATDDGGLTWRHVAPDLGSDELASRLVRAGRDVWELGFQDVQGGIVLLQSGHHGRHWQRMPAPHGVQIGATLSFPSAQLGYLADGKRLFRTTDGGRSWQLVHTAGRDLNGAVFVSESVGLLPVPWQSGLFQTSDGGRTWRQVSVVPSTSILAVEALDGRHWWLIASGLLLRTADGGRSWIAIRLRGLDPESFTFATPTVGYARTVEGLLYRTVDGGRTWRFVDAR